MGLKSEDPAAMEAEIDRIRSLGLDDLRDLWRKTFAASPPEAFSKDFIVRFLCWHLQAQAVGGLDPETVKVLDRVMRGGQSGSDRHLRPGTVLVREYRGSRYTVTAVPGGYLWEGDTYPSLSAVARAITGTIWNGHRFFGVGAAKGRATQAEAQTIDHITGGDEVEPTRSRRLAAGQRRSTEALR
jgi:Protein of unknown function (DUF2924)